VPELKRVGVLVMYSNAENISYSSIASAADAASPQATLRKKYCGGSITSRVSGCLRRYLSYTVRSPKYSKLSERRSSIALLSLRTCMLITDEANPTPSAPSRLVAEVRLVSVE